MLDSLYNFFLELPVPGKVAVVAGILLIAFSIFRRLLKLALIITLIIAILVWLFA